MNAIETNHLTKFYGSARGIENLELTVEQGDFFGFIGPNGAGKSTTIRTLLGLISPTSGDAKVLGLDIRKDKTEILTRVGYLPSEITFYPGMKVKDVLRLSAGLRRQNCDREAEALCRRLQLDQSRRVEDLSLGNRKKVGIVCALQHNPELLILDEATSGLDPVVRGEMLDLFLDFIQDEQHSILLSSHITSDLEQVADSIALLHQGRLIFHKNKDELMQEYGILRCSEDQLRSLPKDWVVASHRGGCGWESLIHPRARVLHALPGAVCDPANIDDIMRFYCGRDHQ